MAAGYTPVLAMLSRRDLLHRAALAGAGALAPRTARAGGRPDLVLVLADDLAAHVLGPYGGRNVPTPAIDRLAAEGVVFDCCYATLSLCAPSRATILTGRYPHEHGVVDNRDRRLADEGDTVAGWLRAAGYRTAYVGKWHMGDDDAPRPGFDHWVSFRGQGAYEEPTLNVDGKIGVARGYVTDLLTDRAIAFLTAPGDAPRFLVLAHKGVHAPFTPAPRHAEAPVHFTLPPPPSLAGKPDWIVRRARAATDEEVVETATAYLRTLKSVDESLGRLLDALAAAGRLDATAVLFGSDNGYFLGEHGMLGKSAIYAASARLPLVARLPARWKPGTRDGRLVANLDLAPTLAELAGVDVPARVRGRSLLAPEPREALLYEYFARDEDAKTPAMRGVLTPRWTYVVSDGFEELYDRDVDPGETTNVAATSAATHALRTRLVQLEAETGYREPPPPPKTPPATRTDAFVLRYDLGQPGDVVVDTVSGLDGLAIDAPLAVVDGRAARRFDGGGVVLAPDAEALDPSRGPWTVQAWVRAEGDGVVLAQSTEKHGFVLGVRDGKPFFLVAGKRRAEAAGAAPIVGRWTHLAGVIDPDARVLLYVDGRRVADAQLRGFVRREPGKGLAVGDDRGAKLTALRGLTGAVASVAIYSGARAASAIADDARGS
jgi:N-acetylglucosamine-6-sulfatase